MSTLFYFKAISRSIGLIALMLVITTCSKNPVTGKKDFMLMSEAQEINMGKGADPQIVAQYGLYQNEQIQKFINDKGQEMAKISHRPHLNYEFKVLDSPVINAFAVPGGYVYFTRGILAHFNNEAEFAGVLGHEIGHITARHSAKQQSKAILAQLGLVVGMVVSSEFRAFSNYANQGMQLLFLKFGRDAESQSDKLGVEYSTKIGYDSKNMANFFKTLSRMREKSGQSIPDFMSTHPNPANRYTNVKELSKEWQAKVPGPYAVNRNQYLQMIDGLTYGEDPRQGYVENNVFYHPELKFQFPVPQSWRLLNSPSQVQMASEDGQSMMLFTLSNQSSLQQAAQQAAEQYKLTPVSTKNTNVSGFNALQVISEQKNEQDPTKNLGIMSYYIQYGQYIYVFHGISLQTAFKQNEGTFLGTMRKFNKLSDPSKINVYPEKIDVQTVKISGTLQQVLQRYGVPQDRMEEMALLNSMQLTDQVQKGSMIKTVEKTKVGKSK